MCTSGGLAAAAVQAEPVHGSQQAARRALGSGQGQHGCCAKLCTRGQQTRASPARRAPSPARAAAGPLRRGTAAPCSTPAPAAPASGFCLTLQGSGGSMGQHNCGKALHPCSGGRSQHQQCCATAVALLLICSDMLCTAGGLSMCTQAVTTSMCRAGAHLHRLQHIQTGLAVLPHLLQRVHHRHAYPVQCAA